MKLSAMKRLTLATLATTSLALLCAAPARADEWSKTYNLSGQPELRIETSDANIRVTTWDQNRIEAKVITSRYKIGEGGIRVEEHQSGDSVEIDVHYPHHNFSVEWGDHRVDILIQMPRQGRVNLRTGDGKIDIAGLKGEMDLHTGDGSENLEAVDGKLHATTGDGHITAQGRFDELELKTGDGHVEVRAELAADLDLHTSDGHIDLDMPITTEGQTRRNEFRGKLNGGGSLLTIRTGDGSIHLRKG